MQDIDKRYGKGGKRKFTFTSVYHPLDIFDNRHTAVIIQKYNRFSTRRTSHVRVPLPAPVTANAPESPEAKLQDSGVNKVSLCKTVLLGTPSPHQSVI